MDGDPVGRNRIRTIAVVLGLTMALGAGALAFVASRGGGSGPAVEKPPTREVLVAAAAIAARTVITPELIVFREIPDVAILGDALSDPALVLGRMAAVPIPPGTPLIPALLADSEGAGGGFSILGPTEEVTATSPAYRAIGLSVPSDRAVSGMIAAGSRVDLLVTLPMRILTEAVDGELTEGTTAEGYYSDATTKVTLTDVEVLAADPDAGSYVLRVDLHEAEELAAMMAVPESRFTFVLRPAADARALDRDVYGETLNRVLERYGFPLPKVLTIDRLSAGRDRPLPDDPLLAPTPAPAASPTPAG